MQLPTYDYNLPDTAASANVAIPVWQATAARKMSTATATPEVSPSRMPRSSSGLRRNSSRSARWAASADTWAATAWASPSIRSRAKGARAVVQTKPSISTGMCRRRAAKAAPRIAANSGPPNAAATRSGSSRMPACEPHASGVGAPRGSRSGPRGAAGVHAVCSSGPCRRLVRPGRSADAAMRRRCASPGHADARYHPRALSHHDRSRPRRNRWVFHGAAGHAADRWPDGRRVRSAGTGYRDRRFAHRGRNRGIRP